MSQCQLSMNINKYALLRNSRGHNAPDLTQAADACLFAGAHGITVHPRRDERHVKLSDVRPLAAWLRARWPNAELNIECEDHPDLIDLVDEIAPNQCTLVPVSPGEVTSDHGWAMPADLDRLKPVIARLKQRGVRVSLFADADPSTMVHFAASGADRVELYTGPYAWAFGGPDGPAALDALVQTAAAARDAGLGVNAGHDLDRHNLAALAALPVLDEVSIGHAQICRALEIGTVQSVQELLAVLP